MDDRSRRRPVAAGGRTHGAMAGDLEPVEIKNQEDVRVRASVRVRVRVQGSVTLKREEDIDTVEMED